MMHHHRFHRSYNCHLSSFRALMPGHGSLALSPTSLLLDILEHVREIQCTVMTKTTQPMQEHSVNVMDSFVILRKVK